MCIRDRLVALNTDHCQPEHVDTFLRPLIAESRRRVERGEAPLFNSHMLDASTPVSYTHLGMKTAPSSR